MNVSRLLCPFVFGTLLFSYVDGVDSQELPLCVRPRDQTLPVIADLGTSGFVVAWEDDRSGKSTIYAQRIDAVGRPRWSSDGMLVSADTMDQTGVMVTPDGKGGALILWASDGLGTDGYPPYRYTVQHVDSNGALLWGEQGVRIIDVNNLYYRQSHFVADFATDGSGGAFFLYLHATKWDASARNLESGRIDASGSIQWIDLTLDRGSQVATRLGNPRIISDGSGGAIVSWVRGSSGFIDITLNVHRLNPLGNLVWTRVLVADTMNEMPFESPGLYEYDMCPDGPGGACFALESITPYPGAPMSESNITAHWLEATGSRPWGADGLSVCSVPGEQRNPQVTNNALDGFIVAWEDSRASTSSDLYAARIEKTGGLPWGKNGIAVCQSAGTQILSGVVRNISGGATIVWDEKRSDASDVYSQSVNRESGT